MDISHHVCQAAFLRRMHSGEFTVGGRSKSGKLSGSHVPYVDTIVQLSVDLPELHAVFLFSNSTRIGEGRPISTPIRHSILPIVHNFLDLAKLLKTLWWESTSLEH